jgi:hypothetical protein
MKRMLFAAAVTLLLFGCSTPDRTITDPAGANRPWDSAQIDTNPGAVPVTSSTDTDKHIWTQTPIPTVPPTHDDFWTYRPLPAQKAVVR